MTPALRHRCGGAHPGVPLDSPPVIPTEVLIRWIGLVVAFAVCKPTRSSIDGPASVHYHGDWKRPRCAARGLGTRSGQGNPDRLSGPGTATSNAGLRKAFIDGLR